VCGVWWFALALIHATEATALSYWGRRFFLRASSFSRSIGFSCHFSQKYTRNFSRAHWTLPSDTRPSSPSVLPPSTWSWSTGGGRVLVVMGFKNTSSTIRPSLYPLRFLLPAPFRSRIRTPFPRMFSIATNTLG